MQGCLLLQYYPRPSSAHCIHETLIQGELQGKLVFSARFVIWSNELFAVSSVAMDTFGIHFFKAAILPPRPEHGVQQIGARWPKAAACLHWPAG